MSRKTAYFGLIAFLLVIVVSISALYVGKADSAADSYAEAQLHLNKGDLRSARVALMNSSKVDPKFLPAQLDYARVSLKLFDASAARMALERALGAGAKYSDVAPMMGHALWLLGDLEKAEDVLTGQQILRSDKAYALRILGRVKMDQGKLTDANSSFEEAVRIAPDDSDLWTDIARLRFIQADQKGAIDAVDYAFKLDAGNVRALEFRGRLMRSQFGVMAALPWFERGLQINPTDVPLLEEYALTLGDAGRYRDMLAQARKLHSLDQNNSKAFYMQAVLAARAGKYELASRILPKAGSTFNELPAARLLSAICAYELGNYNRAVDQFQLLLSEQPRNLRVRTLLAQALYKAGDPLGALDVIREIASRSDADSYSLIVTANAFAASDQSLRAINPLNDAAMAIIRPTLPLPEPLSFAFAEESARREPQNAKIVLSYIRSLAAKGDIETALAEAIRLRDFNTGVAEAHLIVGDLEMARSNEIAALSSYEKAKEISFTEPVLLRLVDAYSQTDNEESASQTLAAYLAYNPLNLSALRLAGYRNLDAKRWKEAIVFLERVRLRLGNNDPVLLANLARAYSGANQHTQAEHLAKTAYRIAPANIFVTKTYGQVLRKSGLRPKAAKELMQKSSQMMLSNTQFAELG